MRKSEWIFLAIVLGAGYWLFKKATAVTQAAGAAYNNARDAVASGLYALFGPNDQQAIGSMTFYRVIFPDGAAHAVGNLDVNADGQFTWTGYPPNSQPGITYQLVKDASGTFHAISP